MKKALISFSILVSVLFLTMSVNAAGWVLYDDFNSYADLQDMLDSGKWNISATDQAIADFSIENGKLKIVHTGSPNDSAWAQIVKGTRKIKGIKVKLLITDWDEEARARIGADIGDLKSNTAYRVWYALELRNRWNIGESAYTGQVVGYASVEEPGAGWDWKYSPLYTILGEKKQTIVGVSHTFTAMFEKEKVLFKVNKPVNYGFVEYELTEEILDTVGKPFRGIGTRTGSNGGSLTVYFDNVYVYK